jgi:hypothetical protein
MVARFVALQELGTMKFWLRAEKAKSRVLAVRKGRAEETLDCWLRK